MFSEESADTYLANAKKISDLKNLGPASEIQLKNAKITSVKQLVGLGWKGAFKRLVRSNPKNRHAVFAYALIGALSNKQWNQISEQEKVEARQLSASLKKLKI